MNCCLCSNLASGRAPEAWNNPLFESANFVSLPSLGSLVEGWLLLVPRHHFICMGALPGHLAHEMQTLKDSVRSGLSRKYGDICIFEHGPSAAKRSVGCGVDHAHLHIVPLNFDLVQAAASFLPPNLCWSQANWAGCRAAFQRGDDYLYVEQPPGRGRIAVHEAFPSQVFRKAIAARLGIPEQFNWREHPHTEAVARTIYELSVFSDSRPAG